MIKFFRKIRYNLMEQNKTGKYFKYAIGEIVLVVIGILIALSINNWNESRKDLKTELNSLISLKQEFEHNKSLLSEMQKLRQEIIEPNKAFNKLLSSGKFTYEDILKGTRKLFWSTSNPSYGVLNSLIASGEINLIKPDSLKFRISNWKDFLVDFLEDEKTISATAGKWSEIKRVKFPNRSWGDYQEAEIKEIYLMEAHQIEYRNRFQHYLTVLGYVIDYYPPVENELDNIIQLIDIRIKELEQ